MDHRRLLLISNSTSYGGGYLDHCSQEIVSFLGGDIKTVTFVPYAKGDRDGYEQKAHERFKIMGYDLHSVHNERSPKEAVEEAEALFIGGGNTFLLLKELYDNDLIDIIRDKVANRMPYIGTSAGSNVACLSIKTTNDMPIVYPPSFDALGLVQLNINPHYIDPDPNTEHKGETRIERINEFHEQNEPPVVGLRESSMLLIENETISLLGPTGAKLFKKGMEPKELAPDTRLDALLI